MTQIPWAPELHARSNATPVAVDDGHRIRRSAAEVDLRSLQRVEVISVPRFHVTALWMKGMRLSLILKDGETTRPP